MARHKRADCVGCGERKLKVNMQAQMSRRSVDLPRVREVARYLDPQHVLDDNVGYGAVVGYGSGMAANRWSFDQYIKILAQAIHDTKVKVEWRRVPRAWQPELRLALKRVQS